MFHIDNNLANGLYVGFHQDDKKYNSPEVADDLVEVEKELKNTYGYLKIDENYVSYSSYDEYCN
ncbi:MAG: hypothetical protein CMC08_00925 [Flavobacteriaceae bacterium]|nr:hypothetical protein [Flavobacteriaceae bacterium]